MCQTWTSHSESQIIPPPKPVTLAFTFTAASQLVLRTFFTGFFQFQDSMFGPILWAGSLTNQKLCGLIGFYPVRYFWITCFGPSNLLSKIKLCLLVQIFLNRIATISNSFYGIFSINIFHYFHTLVASVNHFLRGFDSSPYTSLIAGHFHMTWIIVSSSLSHIGHENFSITIFLTRFKFVGSISWHTLHRKCLTMPGTLRFHNTFQFESSSNLLDVSPWILMVLAISRWYAVLTKNLPSLDGLQTCLSITPSQLIGRL